MPFCLGLVTSRKEESGMLVWAEGFLYEWAIVFVFYIFCLLKNKELPLLINITMLTSFALAIVGIVLAFIKKKRFIRKPEMLEKSEIIYLGIFLAIVLFQIYKAVFFAFEDGDDAYYISVAQSTATSELFYKTDAYTGIPVETPNYRYALAPFPIWITVLSRVTDINVATMSHVILPVALLLVTYVIYYEISKLVFDNKEKRFMFMILTSVFFMFENTSIDTQGTFLLTRARQGKEALACVILPMLFLECFRLVKNDFDIKINDWLLLAVSMTAASLTSLFANVLGLVMILALLLLMLVKKVKINRIFVTALTVIPNILTVLLYVVKR